MHAPSLLQACEASACLLPDGCAICSLPFPVAAAPSHSLSLVDVYSGQPAVLPTAERADTVLSLSHRPGRPVAPGTESIQVYHGPWGLE